MAVFLSFSEGLGGVEQVQPPSLCWSFGTESGANHWVQRPSMHASTLFHIHHLKIKKIYLKLIVQNILGRNAWYSLSNHLGALWNSEVIDLVSEERLIQTSAISDALKVVKYTARCHWCNIALYFANINHLHYYSQLAHLLMPSLCHCTKCTPGWLNF